MYDDLDRHMANFRKDGPLIIALHGSRQITYRIVVGCYVFAGLCHLWLGDAWDPNWLIANILFLAGLILLAWRGAALGWLLASTGKLIPLFFFRDHLNQSLILAIIAFGGALFMAHDGWRHFHGRLEHPDGPGESAFLTLARGVTIATYLLAGIHKINRDFFDRAVGCAPYGVDKLAAYWNVPEAWIPEGLYLASPFLIIAVELAIPLLYLANLRRLAFPLVIAFHIPLTLTMAPAFVFVMIAGHAAFLLPRDIAALKGLLLRHGRFVFSIAFVATAVSLKLHGKWPEWTMVPREFVLWSLLGLTMLLLVTKGIDRAPYGVRLRAWQQRLATFGVLLFFLHGLTPYLGVRFQHTAAMVSSLRIDEGCWNSLIFPESLRISDNYVRVDFTYFREPGFLEEYEAIVLEQLWSPPQIRQMRRNWCRDRVRPFYLEGTYRGRTFAIEDLCDGTPLPFPDDGVFGIELFKDHLLFQKNLLRDCPQKCIH